MIGTYEYDAEGRRVKKVAGGATTYYVYGPDGDLLAEYGGTAASGAQYLVPKVKLTHPRNIYRGKSCRLERLE